MARLQPVESRGYGVLDVYWGDTVGMACVCLGSALMPMLWLHSGYSGYSGYSGCAGETVPHRRTLSSPTRFTP
jgi:hypothetical protein